MSHKSRAARLLVIACSLLMGIAIWPACVAGETNSDTSSLQTIDEENLTDSEEELLRQINVVDEFVYGVEQELFKALSDTELERTQLFEALAESNSVADLPRMLQVVEQTRPVDTLQSDRSTYLLFVKDIAGRSRNYQAAIDADDLFAIHEYAVQIAVARARMVVDVSPFFCTAALALESQRVCEPEAKLGGDYGARLQAIFRNLAAQIRPRIAFVPTQFDAKEEARAADALQAAMADALERALGPVRDLKPPVVLAPDHERLLRYLSDSLDVFAPGLLAFGLQPSATEGLQEFAKLTSSTRDDLSPTTLAIISLFEE